MEKLIRVLLVDDDLRFALNLYKLPAKQVIMLTGHATLESGIEAIREGAFDYLLKPCDIEDLTAKIKEARDVERIKRRPVLWPRNKVEEIICYSFPRLDPQDWLSDALELFRQEEGEQTEETLFVIDSHEYITGIYLQAGSDQCGLRNLS